MASRFDINESGLNRLIDTDVHDSIGEWADEIAEEASRLAPKDTGRLANSIKKKESGDEWKVVAETEYATMVEMGTRDTPPQPYLRPALVRVLEEKKRATGRSDSAR